MAVSRKVLVIVLALGTLVAAGLYYGSGSAQRADGAPAAAREGRGGQSRGATPVEVAQVRVAPSNRALSSVGTLTSDESVRLAAEIAGRVSAFDFQEGQNVKAGDVLVRLDDAIMKAEVQDAQARLKLAEANFRRASTLQQSGSGTTRARDEAMSEQEIARAALELAQVRLDKATLRAPFDGVVGLREVSHGAFVQPGTALVNIEKIDQLKVDFRLPEINLGDVKAGLAVNVKVDAFPERVFEGSILAIDPLLDVNGRALRVRAALDNDGMLLRPGLFARIEIPVEDQDNVVTVPESAIVPQGGQNIVFRVKDGKAEEVKVALGRRTAGEVEVSDGLEEGDVVVTSGHLRLRAGGAVEIVSGDVPAGAS
jgi:membrane fusion protein, multidrug efflux system